MQYRPSNKIGSTAEMKIYEYDHNQIECIWEMGEQLPSINTRLTSVEDGTYEAVIPEYGLKFDLVIPEEDLKRLLQSGSLETLVSEDDFLVSSTHTMFSWNDYDDGQEALLTKQLVYFQTPPFYAATLYVIYEAQDEITPVMAYLATDVKNYLFEVLIEGTGIENKEDDLTMDYLQSSGYSLETIRRALEEMVSESVARKTESGYVINFSALKIVE